MQKTKSNRLKASVDKLHNLAKNNDEIPTDGFLLPIGKTPTEKEIKYYTNLCLDLIEDWSMFVTNEDTLETLNIIESNLEEIIED